MSMNNEMVEEEIRTLQHLSFNQDGSNFVVLSEKGILGYSTEPLLKQLFFLRLKKMKIAEMVYNSSMIGYINEYNKMQLFDVLKKMVFCEIPECKEITGLKFTQKYFVLLFTDEADVYDLTSRSVEKKYWTIQNTIQNSKGICASSVKNDIIAIPSQKIGEVLICNLGTKKVLAIQAHRNPIQCLSINSDGSILATCSNNGKTIKLFRTDDGNNFRGLRRGTTSQEMFSIAFSNDSNRLCCYSSSGTVHEFSISESGKNRTSSLGGLSYIGIGYFGSEWSENEIRLPKKGDFGICSFSPTNSDIVYILTSSSLFHQLDFSTKKIVSTKRLSMSTRKQTQDKIPSGRVPIFLVRRQNNNNNNLKELPKKKYLVPEEMTLGDFTRTIAKKLNLEEKKGRSLKILVGEEKGVVSEHNKLKDLYLKYRESDNFLYMKYYQ